MGVADIVVHAAGYRRQYRSGLNRRKCNDIRNYKFSPMISLFLFLKVLPTYRLKPVFYFVSANFHNADVVGGIKKEIFMHACYLCPHFYIGEHIASQRKDGNSFLCRLLNQLVRQIDIVKIL